MLIPNIQKESGSVRQMRGWEEQHPGVAVPNKPNVHVVSVYTMTTLSPAGFIQCYLKVLISYLNGE